MSMKFVGARYQWFYAAVKAAFKHPEAFAKAMAQDTPYGTAWQAQGILVLAKKVTDLTAENDELRARLERLERKVGADAE